MKDIFKIVTKKVHRFRLVMLVALTIQFSYSKVAGGQGPLPEFTVKGIVLHPDSLSYAPTKELVHPSLIKTESRIKSPLGKYYLYYSPHKHKGISMAYSNSPDGPWTEYPENPVIESAAAPDIRWIQEKNEFYMWGHVKNARTVLWTSTDGIHFEYKGISIEAKNIACRNASYTRVYEFPLKPFGSKYIMLYSGFCEENEIRSVWLAHSKDAIDWTQIQTPLVEPTENENSNLYGASFFPWKDKIYIVYQDGSSWRGGSLKYVEVDSDLNPVGSGGERYVLIDPGPGLLLNNRLRGAEFYWEDDLIYMFSGASSHPRIIVYAIANE